MKRKLTRRDFLRLSGTAAFSAVTLGITSALADGEADESAQILSGAAEPDNETTFRTACGRTVDLGKIAGEYAMRFEGKDSVEPSVVLYTSDISSEGLVRLFRETEWTPEGRCGIKISTGESSRTNHLSPELIEGLVREAGGTIVECNTAYEGNRSETAAHYRLAEEHGYTKIADVDIMDEEGTQVLPVRNGTRLKENIVGSHFSNYGSMIILSHFKGHMMAGFGGAIKNASIGIAAPAGKINIHTGGISTTEWHDELIDEFQEAMAEAVLSVSDALGGGENILYINVMNNISVDCDCDPDPAKADIHDVGILASYDPVALDQACVDLSAAMDGSGPLLLRVADRHGMRALEHGEEIGLGSRFYYLFSID